MKRILSSLLIPVCMSFLLLSSHEPLLGQNQEKALKLYYSANALYNRKLYSLASEEYESFLQKYPGHEKQSQARLGLALCSYAMGNKKKAAPITHCLRC